MRDGWEAEARNWAEFSRVPGQDVAHEVINLPAFLRLLPEPAGLTLDLGCGEAVAAAARVLDRGGRLVMAIPHPVNSAGSFQSRDGDAPFTIAGSYLDPGPADSVIDRNGLRLTFHSEHRPLESYSQALEGAGLVIEAIREPRAPDELVAAQPAKRRWQRIPLSLQLRAVKP